MCFLPAFVHWLRRRGEERCQAEQADVARRGWVLRAWQGDGRWTPGCICRMLSVGPRVAATLGNKGAHCLLHRVSQHLNIHHHVRSPAVFCYRKHFKKYDTADHYLTSLANIHAVVVRIFIILSQRNKFSRCLHCRYHWQIWPNSRRFKKMKFRFTHS